MIKSINPFTEKVLKTFKSHTLKQASNIAKDLKINQKEWKKFEIKQRIKLIKNISKVLKSNKKKYSELMTLEAGKVITKSEKEIEKCIDVCDYYIKNAENFLKDEIVKTEFYKSYVRFEPLGLVFSIMPWNYPFWQVFRSAIPIMCAGNTYILKHSSNVPQCSLAIQDIFAKAGLKKYFRSILIDSKTALKLIGDNSINAITFTGSTRAGRQVASVAGKNIKKTVLELGGSDPLLVLDEKHIPLYCKAAIISRIKASGQCCTSAKRFIVLKKFVKKFENNFVDHMKSLKIGDPMNRETDVGPLAKEESLQNLDRQVKQSIKKGAKLLIGGKIKNGKGYFYMPTIITNVKKNMPVFKEETFGPVAAIIKARDEKHAIELANASDYGLSAGIYMQDIKKGEEVANQIEVGIVFVNKIVSSDIRFPIGGIKNSGYGRELSYYGIKEFTSPKTIIIEKFLNSVS